MTIHMVFAGGFKAAFPWLGVSSKTELLLSLKRAHFWFVKEYILEEIEKNDILFEESILDTELNLCTPITCFHL